MNLTVAFGARRLSARRYAARGAPVRNESRKATVAAVDAVHTPYVSFRPWANFGSNGTPEGSDQPAQARRLVQ